jgi:hypothetical protein
MIFKHQDIKFNLALLIWIIIYVYLNFDRISFKVRYYLDNFSVSEMNNLNVQNLSRIAKTMINKDEKVLFMSDDALAYMYFNLQSYPIIAKHTQVLDNVNIKDYDFVIFYSQKLLYKYKNGVYYPHDIN